jgi:hypothetical protein
MVEVWTSRLWTEDGLMSLVGRGRKAMSLKVRKRLAVSLFVALAALAVGIGRVHALAAKPMSAALYATDHCPEGSEINKDLLEAAGAVNADGTVDLKAVKAFLELFGAQPGSYDIYLLLGCVPSGTVGTVTVGSDGVGSSEFTFARQRRGCPSWSTTRRRRRATTRARSSSRRRARSSGGGGI